MTLALELALSTVVYIINKIKERNKHYRLGTRRRLSITSDDGWFITMRRDTDGPHSFPNEAPCAVR